MSWVRLSVAAMKAMLLPVKGVLPVWMSMSVHWTCITVNRDVRIQWEDLFAHASMDMN